ncbi:aspartic protease family protein, putative [Medicago truncatula]|uniref:Aspartic protease family protein, putative n=1 Tax=Medicago truncatula TaxID=3880 RepID=G7KGS1_MEDTR|nr:aspartic protease family protein, putative [Medicago truncatula]
MVLDTGSELSWLHCKKLPNLNFIFNPLVSSSYTPTPCTSPICTTQTRDLINPVSCDANKLCHIIVSYADSSSMGATLPPRLSSLEAPLNVECSGDEDSKTTGLMGMDLGSLSFSNQMRLPKFSYCISNKDSTGVLVLENIANPPRLGPLHYTPLVKKTTPLPYFNRFAYTVQLEGIRVSEKLLPLPKIRLFTRSHWSGSNHGGFGYPIHISTPTGLHCFKERIRNPNQKYTNTFRVPIGSTLPVLPVVTLMFDGAELRVTGERLLYKVSNVAKSNSWIYCFTFGNSDLLGIEAFIIGHHHQRNVWMEYDLANSRIGFSDTNCDVARQQLAEPHYEEHLTEGSNNYHKPRDLRSTERAQNKAQKPTCVKELTPDLESKVIGPPDFSTKLAGHSLPPVHQRKPKSSQTKIAARPRLPISKPNEPAYRKPAHDI